MQYDHQGMSLWIEPDKSLNEGTIKVGSDANLTVGVKPADASNRVLVRYRVNGGPVSEIDADPSRHVGNAQYFNAQLPCAALRDGDTVEYGVVCQCAGRQVPSAVDAQKFVSSFQMVKAPVANIQAPISSNESTGGRALTSATSNVKKTAVAFSLDSAPIQSVVSASERLKPTHLSLFVIERSTGHPIAHMPFYAEVGVVSVLPPPKCQLQEAIRIGIHTIVSQTAAHAMMSFGHTDRDPFEKLVEPLCDALSRLVAPQIVDGWVKEQDNAAVVIARIIRKALEIANVRGMDWHDPLDQLFEEAILSYATENNLPLAEKNAQTSRIVWSHPLGVLATDHVGYLSFDLTRLPTDVADAVALALEARRLNPHVPTETNIWVYPMAKEEDRIDALAQMRVSHDAIVVKLQLDLAFDSDLCKPKICESIANLGIMAMQNPSLTDWRLSPSSFASNPSALLGEDGCENLFPANVALQEFYFYQVVRLSDIEPPELTPETQGKVKFGVAHEYRLAWYPIGHSLGQIQYSLPLAPGESVNLAIIDWTRSDVGRRTEDTTASEQLDHNQRRDRTITETVNASIKEYQSGSSIMGGLAGAAGASIPIQAVNISAGATHSLGGASSDSEGSRDIVANTVQKLSDNITQSSASMRELQSTVRVQTTQAEKESIETRTVVNYNHSHSLTILYYEVLRHFRVVTEYVRSRPIVLVKVDWDFLNNLVLGHLLTIRNLLENRTTLEAALLDKRHAEGFNALQRIEHRFYIASGTPSLAPEAAPPNPAGPLLRFFNFDIKTGSVASKVPVYVSATLYGPYTMKGYSGEDINIWEGIGIIHAGNSRIAGQISPFGSFTAPNAGYSFTGRVAVPPIPWGAIDQIVINVSFANRGNENDSYVSFQEIKITGVDIDGNDNIVLVDKNYHNFGGEMYADNDWDIILPTRRPQPTPPPLRPIEEIEDGAKANELIEHLRYHNAYYSRALYLNQNVAERASQLDALKLSNDATVLEKVENRPLEMIGNFVAYPCSDSNWAKLVKDKIAKLGNPDLELDERLVTLPTRGLFAEAKLGHCNASEEIDNTRFWKWEEHPIPHSAPEIAAIEAGKHVVKDPNMQSTPFPQSLVNIVNPPNAPDPTGLASAMNVLAASNIFRDMSGRAEVADLLKKLSDNSVAIAGVAQKAATGGVGGSSGATSSGGGSVPQQPATHIGTETGKPAAPPPQTPEQTESQQIENLNKKLDVADKLPPPQKKAIQKVVTDELKKPPGKAPAPIGLGFLITFQRAVYGTPVSGSAKIEIRPFGKRKYGSDYDQGSTIGPPTQEQQTTIPETYEVKIVDGTIMLRTDHASAPGTITITAQYIGSPDIFVNVISSKAYDASTSTFTLQGNRDYVQPTSGDIVVLDVVPTTIPKKIIAKNGESAVSELGTEAGGNILIVTAKATGKYGTTSSGEKGEEFECSLMTGGLTIKQKNGMKDKE